MDLVAALRTFEAVAAERSFTRGAARTDQPQPVASRRVAALEDHLGVRLLQRTSRRVDLTPEGQRLLPLARDVLGAAERVERLFVADVERLVLAVPAHLDHRSRAALRRGLAGTGRAVAFLELAAPERADAVGEHRADLALVATSADRAEVVVPLGVAVGLAAGEAPPARFVVGALRATPAQRSRDGGRPRALHLLAEDDVPPVRDPVAQACYAAGLRQDQVRVATAAPDAWTAVFEHDDAVLASALEAARAGVGWAPLADPPLVRAYRLDGDVLAPGDRDRVLARLATGLGGHQVAAPGAGAVGERS